MFIALTILAELVFIAFIILLFFRFRSRFGLVPLYVILGANQYFQTIIRTRFNINFFGELSIPVGSSILFSAGLFTILLIYIKEGVRTTQRLILAIVLANLFLTMLATISFQQELALSGTASNIFNLNFRFFLVGTIALIVDAFLLVILYEFIYTKIKWLNSYLRLTLTLLLILNLDAFIFVTGGFFENPNYTTILKSHMIGKSIAAIFFASALWFYLRFLDKEKTSHDVDDLKGKEDIFSILTYKGRLEKLQTEKAISDELLQKIIAEKTTELEKSIRRFTILASYQNQRIDRVSSSEQTKEFLRSVKEAFEVDACTIHLIKNEKLKMLSEVGVLENNKEYKLTLTFPYLQEMIQKKRNFCIEDTTIDPAFIKNFADNNKDFQYISCAGAPLIRGENVMGILKLYSVKEKRRFTELEMEHLQLVASQSAQIIENSQLFEQNEKHKEILVKQIAVRKKVEEAIIESEAHAMTLFNHSAVLIWEEDFSKLKTFTDQLKQQGINDLNEYFKNNHAELQKAAGLVKVLSINQKSKEFYGVETEDELVQNIPAWFIPESWNTFREEIVALTSGNTNFEGEIQIKTPGGDLKYLYVNTSVPPGYKETLEKVIVSFVDITEKKTIEIEKQSLLIRNQQTITTMLDGFILAEGKGMIIEVNPAYCKMIGYSHEELVGKNINEIEASMSQNEVERRITEMMEKKSIQFETKHKRKDNFLIDLEVSVSIMISDGQPLLAAFVRDITERKAEQELIKTSHEHLRQLTGHLQTIREEERSRIGQEIHDQLGQHLTVLKMDVSRLKKNIPVGKNKEEDLLEIISELDNCLQMVRKIAADLRPSIIDDLGLIAALEWQAEDFEKRTEITTKFYSNVSDLKIPSTHSIGLFRIFQESLTNVARHAEAKEVVAELNKENGFLILTITDNGKGFNTNSVGGKRSLGLLGMRERTLLMNGKYEISSEAGKGTAVKVTVPI